MATGGSRRRETISTFIHDDDAAPVHAAVEAPALPDGRTLTVRLLPPLSYHGGARVLHVHAVPPDLAGEAEADHRLLVIGPDDESATDFDLEGERRRFETFFHNASDAVLLHDTTGRIVDANDVALGLLGYDLRELRDRTIGSLHPGGSSDAPKNVDLSVGEVMVFEETSPCDRRVLPRSACRRSCWAGPGECFDVTDLGVSESSVSRWCERSSSRP